MKSLNFFKAVFIAAVLFSSCSDDDNNDGSEATDQDLLQATAVIDYVNESDFQTSNDVANNNDSFRVQGPNGAGQSICADITITTNNGGFPKVFTLDFGDGCTDNLGIERRGKLIITLTGMVLANGSTMTIERDNYFINDYKVEGAVEFTNITTDPAIPTWTRTIENGTVTTPEGVEYDHAGTRTVRQIEGVATLIMLDNVYEVVSGMHSVTGPGGNTLTATVTSPLIKSYMCPFLSSGVLNLQGEWLDGDLDYGNGDCDPAAIYTHEPTGESYNVILN